MGDMADMAREASYERMGLEDGYRADPYWIDREQKKHYVRDMKSSYIVKVIEFLQRRIKNTNSQYKIEWAQLRIECMKIELSKRDKLVRVLKLHDIDTH